MNELSIFLNKVVKDFIYALSGKAENFTSGSIRRAIFLLSVPMVLEMSMESIFALVDIYFVNMVGTNAVATVGLTESVLMIVYSIAIGLSMAITAIVSRRIGEKKNKKAGDAAFQGIVIGIAMALVIGVPGYLFSGTILSLMGGSETLISEGIGYTQIMFAGNISILLLFLNNSILRGAGNASYAMYALIISNTINMILDPLLIFGVGPFPELGVQGAAVATNIGRSIGVLFQLFIIIKGTSVIRVAKENIMLKLKDIGEIFKISFGGVTQFIVESLSWMFLIRIMSEFGEDAVAGYTLAFRVIVFTILPSWGMSNAAATLVGQNLGAGQATRAEKSVWLTARYNVVFLGLVSLVFYLFAQDMMEIFRGSSQLVKDYGAQSLRIICLGYVFFAYGMVISQSFNGAGNTSTPMIINLVCFWIIQIPMAYWLAYKTSLGSDGVLWSIAICHSIHAIISIWIFKKGAWKSVKV